MDQTTSFEMASWSTLVQAMTCCLTAPSHYLTWCYSGVPKGWPPTEIPLKCGILVRINGTKILPSNQKSSVLYLWKILLNFMRYSLRNHKIIKRWLLRRIRCAELEVRPPLFHCFGRIEHWQINQDSEDSTHFILPFKFMVYQTNSPKYFMRLSVWSSNKIITFLFA